MAEMDIGTEDEQVVYVPRRKWFEVDFNEPKVKTIVASSRALPVAGEDVMVYTMDDDPPFAFEAKVDEVRNLGETWLVSFVGYGARWEFKRVG